MNQVHPETYLKGHVYSRSFSGLFSILVMCQYKGYKRSYPRFLSWLKLNPI